MADNLNAFDDAVHVNRIRKKAMVLLSLGFFIDGYDLLVIGVALLFLIPKYHMTSLEIGLVGAASFLGAAIGLVVVGDLTDRVGRRTIFIINLAVFIVFAILAALVNNLSELFIIRFFMGVGIGADMPTSMSYVAEVTPKRWRGAYLGGVSQTMWTLGALFSALLGLLLASTVGPSAWRWMFGLGALPGALVLLGRQSLPESPRWLLTHGRVAEARVALQKMGMPEVASLDNAYDNRQAGTYREIFRAPYAVRTALATALFGLVGLGGGVASVASPYIFRYVGLLGIKGSILSSIGIWVISTLGAALSIVILDRWGRFRVGIVATLVAGFSDIFMGWFGKGNPSFLIPFFILAATAGWMGSGTWWSLPSELFPTRLRGKSQGFSSAVCRVMVGADIFLIPAGIRSLGFTWTMVLFSLTWLIMAILLLRNRKLEPNQLYLDEVSLETALSPRAL